MQKLFITCVKLQDARLCSKSNVFKLIVYFSRKIILYIKIAHIFLLDYVMILQRDYEPRYLV